MFNVSVIADSISYYCPRLTSFQLTYPRFVHAELMTHRVFSRNASSSRAIPVKTFIDNILYDPAMPVWWGKNQAGMQAKEELDQAEVEQAKSVWLGARDQMVEKARSLHEIGLHKQITNRILEPWMYISVIVTSTFWDNWYALRSDKDAQPEIQHLANMMLESHNKSVPKVLQTGEWHLPYISEEDREYAKQFKDKFILPKWSSARSARVSYLNHDNSSPNHEKDLATYNMLMANTLKHASPTEHQAMASNYDNDYVEDYIDISQWGSYELDYLSGNLARPWVQFRKLHRSENVESFAGLKRYKVESDGTTLKEEVAA